MLGTIAEFIPKDAEAGVGLAIQDDEGRYLFVLAGLRHRCPPGQLFYAGIGGHREKGESWLACAYREAAEELGTDIEILPAEATWHVSRDGTTRSLLLTDEPPPFALYEMVHPPGSEREGQIYHLVIYMARLRGVPESLPEDETQGIIALEIKQVIQGAEHKPRLADLVEEGASFIPAGNAIDERVRVYPIGTALALAHILGQGPSEGCG
jgi:8-oxo-dGTP pyrophosphatase MutT (NUDIX family)